MDGTLLTFISAAGTSLVATIGALWFMLWKVQGQKDELQKEFRVTIEKLQKEFRDTMESTLNKSNDVVSNAVIAMNSMKQSVDSLKDVIQKNG